ncbi:MAG: hypothetical protein ACOYVF_09820 [Candidatus Zixiibacteriota bacterium]
MKIIYLLLGAALLAALILAGPGCDREVTYSSEDDGQLSLNSCFTCHGEEGTLLAAKGEWQNSVHSSGSSVDYTNRGGSYYDCVRCHDHQGFVDFVETGTYHPPYDQVSAIHCFTCHSPHERGNLTLRTDDPYTLENNYVFDHGSANLCVNCHHARIDVRDIVDSLTLSSYWGPHHGPQGDLLAGTNGFEFDDYDYETSPHAFAVEDGCIGCHMGNVQTHDGYEVGGHSFNMMFVNEVGDTSNLVKICADSACHPSAKSYNVEGAQTEIAGLLEDLETLLYEYGVIDSTGLPLEAEVPDKNVTGAVYNFLIVAEDRSMGVHNFKYMKGLLESSIEYMESLIVPPTSGGGGLAMLHMKTSH